MPVLGRKLPLPIPKPVGIGVPSDEFPRPWSVYQWIPGETASIDGITSLSDFASQLAGFLTALYGIDAQDGPVAGSHNFFRGGPLSTYDEQSRDAIRLLDAFRSCFLDRCPDFS